jgi:hypothetical protein
MIECTRACGGRQTEIHTAEPFVPEPSASEVEIAIGKLQRYKLPGAEQIEARREHCILTSINLLS